MQKIAVLLIALGEEHAAQIMAYLEPEHVTAIAQEIARTGMVTNQDKRAVLREFRTLVAAEEPLHALPEYAWDHRADRMPVSSAPQHADSPAIQVGPSYLTNLTACRAAELLRGEPETLVALLLKRLPEEMMTRILECIPSEEREGIVMRLHRTPAPSLAVQAQLEQALRIKAARYKVEEVMDGEAALAEMMHETETLGIEHRQAGLDAYREAQSGQDDVVTKPATPTPIFDDLLYLPLVQLRTVLRRAVTNDIQLALLGADALLRERLLNALPFTRRMAVQARSSSRANVRLGDILDAQQRILALTEGLLPSRPVSVTRQEEPVHV